MSQTHIIPIKDKLPHIASTKCKCKPTQDSEQPSLYHHNAYDKREVYEGKCSDGWWVQTIRIGDNL